MKLLTGIIIALVIVGGVFLVLNNKTPTYQSPAQQNQGLIQTTNQPTNTQTSPTVENQMSASISLTDQGFEPTTITIKAGTKVVWTNKSSDAATVNSDPHPTHTLFPFLNLGRFEPEKTLDVVFQNKGTFTYHNHLNPSERGTVIVE